MPWTSKHLQWFIDTGENIFTTEGQKVVVYEFQYNEDPIILSAWAKHFRNHYCLDVQIDFMRSGLDYSREDYLNKIKFPDIKEAPGPSIRAGDFGEILAADYLEYILKYWVPRTRYSDKTIRNESTKGSDIIGFKIVRDGIESTRDTLAIFEAKTQFTGSKAKERLQDAVDGSVKDKARKGESLNAMKQRLFDKGKLDEAKVVERFQNMEDRPYKEVYGAVALFSTQYFDSDIISNTVTSNHPNEKNLILLVIKGNDFMPLVHELYRRAANEA